MDVHINRMPIGGRVTKVGYHQGRFLPAYKHEAGDLNEYTEVWLDRGGQTLVVRQIVGVLARRIVCRTHVGAVVNTGDRFGVLKFGSRMDLFLPRGPEVEDESIGAFIRRRLGAEALEKLAEPIMAGIYVASADELSLRSTFPRFAEMEREHRSLIKAMRKRPGASANATTSTRRNAKSSSQY
jgi:hypothetical protein